MSENMSTQDLTQTEPLQFARRMMRGEGKEDVVVLEVRDGCYVLIKEESGALPSCGKMACVVD